MSLYKHNASHRTGEMIILGPSTYLLCRMVARGALVRPGILEKGLFHLFLSPHRARRSANVKVITWGTGWTASQSSCPLTAAYKTTGSATPMPAVPTCISRVSVARGCWPKALGFRAWGRDLCKGERKQFFNLKFLICFLNFNLNFNSNF